MSDRFYLTLYSIMISVRSVPKGLKLTSAFLAFFFLISAPAFSAQPVSSRSILIYGKVMNRQTQAPLANALVTAAIIPNLAGQAAIFTNQQGEYSLSVQIQCPLPWLKSFYCLVTCTKDGYFYQTKFFYIGQKKEVALNFPLKPEQTLTDIIPPSGTIEINNNTAYSNSLSVTLNLSAQDNTGGSGVSQMQFSSDNSAWSAPENYSTTKSWALTSGDGIKTVYIKYKDIAGNWSQTISDTIILDTTPPELSITSPLDNEVIKP